MQSEYELNMSNPRDEIQSELIWRYVELIRESPESRDVVLSRKDLDDLTATLDLAGQMPHALAAQEEIVDSAVRSRLEAALREQPRRPATTPERAPAASVPAWQFRLAMGAALVLSLVVTTVNGWHQSPRRLQHVAVLRDAVGIEGLDEVEAHSLIPAMLLNKLDAHQEKNLMAHLVLCPGCYQEYRARREGLVRRGPGHSVLASHQR